MEDGFLDLFGEVVASCEESEREGEYYGDLWVGKGDFLDEDLMEEAAVTDYECFILFSYFLLLDDSLERSKYSLGNQLADYLMVHYALLLERWIGKIAILLYFGLSVFHNSLVQLQDDVEQPIVSVVPVPEGFNPGIEGF